MPERLKTDIDTLQPDYAKYTAEPFERGFGMTLGNSLRRVLPLFNQRRSDYRSPN